MGLGLDPVRVIHASRADVVGRCIARIVVARGRAVAEARVTVAQEGPASLRHVDIAYKARVVLSFPIARMSDVHSPNFSGSGLR